MIPLDRIPILNRRGLEVGAIELYAMDYGHLQLTTVAGDTYVNLRLTHAQAAELAGALRRAVGLEKETTR